MATQFDPSKFMAMTAKPLPVILLLDTSLSMKGEKIDSLNAAVRRMLATFMKEESQASEYLVSIITFGGGAMLKYPPTSASKLHYNNLTAQGNTPLGAAVDIAKLLIEDKATTPSRAYRPLVVLVSDGCPNDAWKNKLEDFINNDRSSKCDRMALGVGQDAISGSGRETLDRFVAGTDHKVFEAKDSGEISQFFKLVTMSVVTRSLSKNPNQVPVDKSLAPPEPKIDSSIDPPKKPTQDFSEPSEDEITYW